MENEVGFKEGFELETRKQTVLCFSKAMTVDQGVG